MKQEFIPWEEAFELKQLGFNEECLGEWQNLKSGKNLVVDEECDRIFDVPVLGAPIKAPLYQQAFRWFREKGIRFFISSRLYDIGLVYKVNIQDSTFVFYDFNTYEEAELACLKKLIEIVKSNNSKK